MTLTVTQRPIGVLHSSSSSRCSGPIFSRVALSSELDGSEHIGGLTFLGVMEIRLF